MGEVSEASNTSNNKQTVEEQPKDMPMEDSKVETKEDSQEKVGCVDNSIPADESAIAEESKVPDPAPNSEDPQPVQPTSTTTQPPAKKKKKKISKQEKPAASPDPPTNTEEPSEDPSPGPLDATESPSQDLAQSS